MHCLQRAVWRKRGSNSADNFVQICTLLPRKNGSGSPACVKPLPRCTQAGATVQADNETEN